MAFNVASIEKKTSTRPPLIVLHGGPGVGKTTLASEFPNPVFLQTEQGEGCLNISAFPPVESFEDVVQAIGNLVSEEHDYQTLVLDSLDHLEPLIWAKVCKRENVETIERIGYAKGYEYALDDFRTLFDGLDALRDRRGMMIVLICHSQLRTINNPETESFDQYQLKLHKKASALVTEKADVIGFAKHEIRVKKEDKGFGQSRARGISTGNRVMGLVERPAYIAKNRYGMPDEIPLHFESFMNAFRGGN